MLLPIGAIELAQVSTDAFLDLRHAPRVKLRSRLFTALNLLPSIATVGFATGAHCRHSAMNFAQTFRIATPVLPELGDRLAIGSQSADHPHHLDIAVRLTFEDGDWIARD
jgi:hypothetical protein